MSLNVFNKAGRGPGLMSPTGFVRLADARDLDPAPMSTQPHRRIAAQLTRGIGDRKLLAGAMVCVRGAIRPG